MNFLRQILSKSILPSVDPPFFIAFILFGQVFFSTAAYLLGIDNRPVMLSYRALIALYSFYIICNSYFGNKAVFSKKFPLALVAFWFIYFVGLIRDYFFLGVTTALPVWEFFAWGLGSCFLPSYACYLLGNHHDRDSFAQSILSYGFLLLTCAAIFFVISVGINAERFQLPSLNPINASHSYYVLALIAISCLVNDFIFD